MMTHTQEVQQCTKILQYPTCIISGVYEPAEGWKERPTLRKTAFPYMD